MTAPRKIYQAIGGTPASARSQIEAVGPMSTTTATPTVGQVLTWDGTSWIPGAGGGGGTGGLVWPLGTPWSDMITALATAGDAAILLVEGDPTGAPRQITGKPDGMGGYLGQDFSHIIFVGAASNFSAGNTVTVELGLGATLNPGVLRSRDIMWAPLFPDIVSGPTAAYDVDLDGGGITPPGPLAGGSVFRAATSNGVNTMRLRNGAVLDGSNLAATDECISRIRPGFSGEVVLTIVSYGGRIGPRSFINFVAPAPIFPFPLPVSVTGIVSMFMDAKTLIDPAYQASFSTPPPHSLVLLQQDLGARDNSAFVSYDDTVVPAFGVDNVQGAIDALKASGLSGVLGVGNTTGANDILITAGQALDAELSLGTLSLGTVNAKIVALGNNTAALADDDPIVVINQAGVSFLSNAGMQFSSKRANRAQFRGNQFGANTAGAGATGFKSRGTNIGDMASVVAGDLLYRITAIGVAADNASAPLAAFISLQVPTAGVGANYVATELELQLVPLEGPINGAKVMFKITSQGVPVLRETALPAGGAAAGLAVLGAGGTITVANPSVQAGTRFVLTVQDGGAAPSGSLIYVSARVAGVSFTVTSIAGAGDAGVQVYWQLWEGV